MRHVKLEQNLDRYSSCSLPTFSNAHSFLPNSSHFASNPQNPQPAIYMPNSEILSRYLSNYSVQPQRPPTPTTVLPQYHASSNHIYSNAPLLPGEDGSSDVSSICWFNSTPVSVISFFIFLYKFCDFSCISVSYRE